MTRVGAMPHRIELVPRSITERDDRNNEAVVDLEHLTGIPARVDIIKETEDTDDRDAQTERITAVIPVHWRGVELGRQAYEALVFNGRTYELTGETDLRSDHAGRRDHLELAAKRVVG